MIGHQDIVDYFDYEAAAARERHRALMSKPLSERVRCRKAIAGIHITEGCPPAKGGKVRLTCTYSVNLSDFKVGDALLLHKRDEEVGRSCTLYAYNDDSSLVVELFAAGNPPVDSAAEYVLDTGCVDLRGSVYNKFCGALPVDDTFWRKHLVNTCSLPHFVNSDECAAELDDTIHNFGFSLTPRQYEAIVKSMSAEDYYLIQGPPGTGKTFVLAIIILEEMLFFHHRVVVVGPNHLAVNNVLEKVVQIYPELPYEVCKVGQEYNAPSLADITNLEHLNVAAANALSPCLLGMTPHALYTSRAAGLRGDTLIVDEAGQMTLPLSLMGLLIADKVLFAGDHKQLPPIISSDKIAGTLRPSIFQHLLREGNYTMLDTSFRMRTEICAFISELFYDGQLYATSKALPQEITTADALLSFRRPIVLCDVADDGQQVSDKEAAKITTIVRGYLALGLSPTEIGIMSPFRAQVANIRRHLRKDSAIAADDKKQITVDTIDKMQGQERTVIIVSLVSGDIDYMQEMGDFLYNPNKLNVAFSRAKVKLIIVANVAALRHLDASTFPHIATLLRLLTP